MKHHRTLVGILLGLVLLVQGYAVSAASWLVPFDPPVAEVGTMAEPPCHGTQAPAPEKQTPCCCDATCPDMTSCALGHLASAAVIATVVFPPDGVAMPDAHFLPVAGRVPSSLLRPPITLHG